MSDSVDLDSQSSSIERDASASREYRKQKIKNPLLSRVRSMGRWRKLALYSALLLCGLYLVSLIVMNGSWFKSKITKRLELKSGLEWKVGSIYWVPFGRVYLNNTSSGPSEGAHSGGITIDSIIVTPSWKKLFSGELVWNDVLLDGVVIDLEKEWLEGQMKNSSAEGVPVINPQPNPNPKLAQKSPKKNTSLGQSQKGPVKPVRPNKAVVEKTRQPEMKIGPERWFRLKNCQVRIRNKEQAYLELKDISMEVPFSGVKQSGAVSILGEKGERLKFPVSWDSNMISVSERDLVWHGVKFQLQIFAQRLGHSMPFQFELVLDDQALAHHVNQRNMKVAIQADHLRGSFLMRGNLLSTQTWNGIGGLSMESFSIYENQKTHQSLHFDRVYSRVRVLHGSLLIEDAQAQSEEISFMANGVITKNSYAFGVLRCVANREYSEKLSGIHNGTKAIQIDHRPYYLFENLGTPDRQFFDLRFDGRLFNLQMKHNRSKTWQSLKVAVDRLKKFKDDELKEDGLFLSEE